MGQNEVDLWSWKGWIEDMERESKLKDALDELRAERKSTLQKLEELDRLIQGLEARIGGTNGAVASTIVMHASEFSKSGIADAAEKMIRRAQRPLHAKDITEGLLAGGYKFSSGNQLKSVGAVLWSATKDKSGPLVRKGKNVYTLRDLDKQQ